MQPVLGNYIQSSVFWLVIYDFFPPWSVFPEGLAVVDRQAVYTCWEPLFSARYSSVRERRLASLCVVRPLLPFGFAVTEKYY